MDYFTDKSITSPSELKEIAVTETHISQGKTGDGKFCPLALAISEQLKIGDAITTTKQVFYYEQPFDRESIDMVLGKYRISMFDLDEEAVKILKEYDTSGVMLPFKTQVAIPITLL